MNKFVKMISLPMLCFLLVAACNNKKRIEALETNIKEGKSNPAVTPIDNPAVKPEGPLPAFTFDTTDHDFGSMTEGDVVEYTYTFKNTGDAPLVIQGAQGSCGCTVPEWSKDPVPPGDEGFVKAKFNSAGKHDKQNKTVTITANTYPRQTVLKFTAMVNAKAK